MKDIDLQKEFSECQTEEDVAVMCDRVDLNRDVIMRDRRQCCNVPAAEGGFDRSKCKLMFIDKKRKKKK